jgi:ABC-2 type transport system ATP-binding protein
MIELIDLVKRFGDLVAVDGINLTLRNGEFFAMLGPNAAGKTTTIKMMTGLIKPTSGRALIAGFDVQTKPLEARRRLAYVPDFPFLYDKLTPWEFLRFTGQLFGMNETYLETAGRELAGIFNLESFLSSPIEGLSHGTRQRVAIASALLHNPEVFVIDEPMVGLDPQHARVVKDVLKERSAQGMTVFVSTHQLSVAEEMADRIGIIHRGRLIAVGTREELRKQSGTDGALEKSFLALTAEDDRMTPEAGRSQATAVSGRRDAALHDPGKPAGN